VLHHVGIQTSGDTLLRVMRRTAEANHPEPCVVGIDDWAFKKSKTYGTIVVDLERHQVIDLLPNRTAVTLATWLKAHPGIQVICRDRAGAYAEGARVGAPAALQIADRWHLLRNVWDALVITYNSHQSLLRQLTFEALPQSTFTSYLTEYSPSRSSKTDLEVRDAIVPSAAEQARAQRRAYWQSKFDAVQALREQGLSLHAIARQ
jgi:transposase